jgi:nickel-dependent lactate racemase
VMPGVAHIDAITHHHGKLLKENWGEVYGIGRYRKNVLLDDLREFGRKVPLDAKIDFMVNSAAEAVGLFVGDPDDVYAAQADLAAGHYRTLVPARADIVIANAYAKANEAMIALSLAEEMLKDGGDIVVLCDVDDGQAIHYLLGRFGKDSWGRLAFGERQKAAAVRRIFVYSRFKDHQGRCWFGQEDDVTWCNDIHGLMRDLDADYAGRSPTVFVIPDGTTQTARFADKA